MTITKNKDASVKIVTTIINNNQSTLAVGYNYELFCSDIIDTVIAVIGFKVFSVLQKPSSLGR